MRIWFIEIGEPLPIEPGKRLLRYGMFTKWLAARGHDVTWFSSTFSHAVKRHVVKPGLHTLDTGVKLEVLDGVGYKKNVCFMRFLNNQKYACTLKNALQNRTDKPDLIVCPIPTVENAGVAAAFARAHNIPFILDIRDHWPDDLVARFPSFLRPLAKIALKPLYKTARMAATSANGITGVTKLQRDYGLMLANRKENPTRDHVFYIGYSRQVVAEDARAEATTWWQAQGLDTNKKIIAFAGTLGVSFDFAPVLECARQLEKQGRRDVQFVIAGNGGARAQLMQAAGPLLGNTILLPGWVDMPKIDVLLTHATAALAPYIPGTSMSLPNKFFEYMAYGLPVLSSCSGESADIISQHHIGLQYDPSYKDSFYDALLKMIDNKQNTDAMRQAAQGIFEQKFNQDMLFTQMEAYMTATVKAAS